MAFRIRTVGLNALFLLPGHSGGPETYLHGLVPALAREFPTVRFTVVTTRSGATDLARKGWRDIAEVHGLPVDEPQRLRRLISEQAVLPWLARRRKFDVLHSLASVAPVWAPVPAVITLHDVTFLRIKTFSGLTTLAFRMTTGPAARRADSLVTGSTAARDDICAAFGLDPARFIVVPHGPGRPAGRAAEEDAVRRKYDLEAKRVVLSVGAKRPHKNQELLVRASALLPPDVVTVLVGRPEPYEATLRAVAEELSVSSRVRFVDFASDSELEELWRLATCVAFPTRAEGFGLPVLEAMTRGVPVACSDIPVLREVGADIPFYFDPDDPMDAAQAITAAMQASDRVQRGRERASAFTWEQSARGTFEAYERAVANARS